MEPDQVARFERLFAAHYGDLMLVQDVPACFPGPADAVYTTNGVEVR